MSEPLSVFNAYRTLYENIRIQDRQPVFAGEHLHRLNASLQAFRLPFEISQADLDLFLDTRPIPDEPSDLRITVSPDGIHMEILPVKTSPYTPLPQGLTLEYSDLLRSETSVYHRHLSPARGDLFLERNRLDEIEADDLVFLNSKWEICESTCANIFFRKEGTFYTPPVSCGLIPGIMRDYLMKNYTVKEEILHPEDIWRMDGCFLTSLTLGLVPVRKLGGNLWSV